MADDQENSQEGQRAEAETAKTPPRWALQPIPSTDGASEREHCRHFWEQNEEKSI